MAADTLANSAHATDEGSGLIWGLAAIPLVFVALLTMTTHAMGLG